MYGVRSITELKQFLLYVDWFTEHQDNDCVYVYHIYLRGRAKYIHELSSGYLTIWKRERVIVVVIVVIIVIVAIIVVIVAIIVVIVAIIVVIVVMIVVIVVIIVVIVVIIVVIMVIIVVIVVIIVVIVVRSL